MTDLKDLWACARDIRAFIRDNIDTAAEVRMVFNVLDALSGNALDESLVRHEGNKEIWRYLRSKGIATVVYDATTICLLI
jgi:hypothetical protein